MKALHLIELLQKIDPESEIVFIARDDRNCYEIDKVIGTREKVVIVTIRVASYQKPIPV